MVFEGRTKGKIVSPRGVLNNQSGWYSLFQPDSLNETFAEMDEKHFHSISHRVKAMNKFH